MTTLPVTVARSCVERNASASRRSLRALRYAIPKTVQNTIEGDFRRSPFL